jgi:hypothetical protein
MLPPHKDDHGTAGDSGDRDERISELVKQAQALNDGVSELVEGTGTALVGLAARGRSTRRWVTLIGASLVLDVLLTVGLGFTLARVEGNSHRVDTLSSNLRTQICGMLGIFVNSDTPQNAAIARARGDDMAARANSYAIIHRSYSALDCSKLVK